MFTLYFAAACRQDIHDQPRHEPLERSEFFDNQRSVRPLVEGTVPRGYLRADTHFYTGIVNGRYVDTFPFPISREVVERGRKQYDVFCSPCHSRVGDGNGMIVQRGFPKPPSFHTDRLRQAPVGHFFDIETNGFGRMYSYADRVSPRDRWAIIAYIRALQLSHSMPAEELSEEDLNQLAQSETMREAEEQ